MARDPSVLTDHPGTAPAANPLTTPARRSPHLFKTHPYGRHSGTMDRALVGSGNGAEAQDWQTSGLLRLIHDLNNVVTTINGYADLLAALTPPPDHARHCTEEIKKAGVKAAWLARSLAPISTIPSPLFIAAHAGSDITCPVPRSIELTVIPSLTRIRPDFGFLQPLKEV